MSGPPNVCVFCAKGRMFRDALRSVRLHEPRARVCALVPAGYLLSGEERALVDDVIAVEQARYGRRDLAAFMRLVRQVRAARFDTFVILFDTPRQRIFAALSGARQHLYCRMDGQLVPVNASIAGTLALQARRRIRGQLTYAWIWLVVRLFRVR